MNDILANLLLDFVQKYGKQSLNGLLLAKFIKYDGINYFHKSYFQIMSLHFISSQFYQNIKELKYKSLNK
jgi:hypothetical protein